MWQVPAALRDFNVAYVGLGSNSVIRRCPLNARFARKRTWLGDLPCGRSGASRPGSRIEHRVNRPYASARGHHAAWQRSLPYRTQRSRLALGAPAWQRIVELAANSRLPGMYQARAFVDAGDLMSYGANLDDLFRRTATREFVQAGGLVSYGTSLADAHRLQGVYSGRLLKRAAPPCVTTASCSCAR
jgi:hypothetical protein